MLKGAFRRLRHAILLARVGGLRVFWHQIKRHLYSRATLVGVEKDLDDDSFQAPCEVEYSLRLASETDMEEVLQKSKSETKESAHDLIQRKWFYESGFHNCYVARTVDTDEVCHIQWLISSEDEAAVSRGFKGRLPKLKADEVLLENAFTFVKYRGKGIMPSVQVKLAELAKSNGFKRMLAYVHQDNRDALLKAFESVGFKKFEKISELKFLFFTKRSHS